MKKIDFRFMTNKLFLSGLITGIIISAVTVTLVMLTHSPAPDAAKVKGTMSGNWTPSINSAGTIMACGSQCGYGYRDVIFGGDPSQTLFRCHLDLGAVGDPVIVSAINGGQFCSGGGIFVSLVPVGN